MAEKRNEDNDRDGDTEKQQKNRTHSELLGGRPPQQQASDDYDVISLPTANGAGEAGKKNTNQKSDKGPQKRVC